MLPLLQRSFLAAACLAALTSLGAADNAAGADQEGESRYDVPDGTPAELLAFIKKQQRSEPRGTTRKERAEHLQKSNWAIVEAAERIAQAKPDEATAAAAVKAEFEALGLLKRVGDSHASEKLEALAAKLKNDKRPAIAAMFELRALSKKLENLDASDADAVEGFIGEVKRLVAAAPPEAQTRPLAQAAAVLLYRSGKTEQAVEMAREFAQKFSESDTAEVAAASAQLAGLAGQMMEIEGREKQAAKFYREFADRLAKNDDSLVQEAAEQLEASARKLELIGQPMPVSGKLVEGGHFDVSQYKGKVVLVDFWATWCGPCVAELPNVKEVYGKFHDRGFEVVGISLDNDVDALTKFIEEEQIAWPILFEGGDETSGWGHPLAKKYGVSSIPTAVLVNRQGKVVTLSARGEKLGELVEELLGAAGPKRSPPK